MKVRRDKRLIGHRVLVINPQSPLYNRQGKIVGFRGDQDKGNPYVQVAIVNHHVETIPASSLMLFD